MDELTCKHCGGVVNLNDKTCSNCGIPLPPMKANAAQRKFIWFFIGVVIFCFFMMYWLPPNWV